MSARTPATPRTPARRSFVAGALALAATVPSFIALPAHAQTDPIRVGFVGAMSGQSAKSGEALTRGLQLAIDEINARGGVLGRRLALVVRDDESNPAKGQTAARELIQNEKVAVIFGGIDTPVAMAIVPIANKERVPYVGAWAAGTAITRNGATPNYVFRVSAVDEIVDKALVIHAMKSFGSKTPGLMLINNPWGESNEKGLGMALASSNLKAAGIEKFEERDIDMTPQLQRLRAAGADALFLVANATPGAQMMRSLERMNWKVPVISHWGISGGRFPELAGRLYPTVEFVQTYSFFGPQNDVGKRFIEAARKKYPDLKDVGDLIPPVGYANAYDAMQLTALAMTAAGSVEGDAIRQGFYKVGKYQGLIKTYTSPFTPANHDALTENDYVMVRYKGDDIVPVTLK